MMARDALRDCRKAQTGPDCLYKAAAEEIERLRACLGEFLDAHNDHKNVTVSMVIEAQELTSPKRGDQNADT